MECVKECVAVGAQDGGAVVEGGAGGQGVGDVCGLQVGVVVEVGVQAVGLVPEGGFGTRGEQPGHGRRPHHRLDRGGWASSVGGSSMMTWALVPLTPKEEMPARRGGWWWARAGAR
ncbi:hypothetical protein NKH77_48675 [Streptomyces sp. M19]